MIHPHVPLLVEQRLYRQFPLCGRRSEFWWPAVEAAAAAAAAGEAAPFRGQFKHRPNNIQPAYIQKVTNPSGSTRIRWFARCGPQYILEVYTRIVARKTYFLFAILHYEEQGQNRREDFFICVKSNESFGGGGGSPWERTTRPSKGVGYFTGLVRWLIGHVLVQWAPAIATILTRE